jgi:hypothetical protein
MMRVRAIPSWILLTMTGRELWSPGTRIARLRASHSYGVVLALIVATFVFMVAAPDDDVARDVLAVIESSMLAAALWASGLGWRRPVVGLIALTIVVAAVQFAGGGPRVTGLVASLNVILVATTIWVIALGVVDQREVNRQSISGAVCAYLLIGLLFAFLYTSVAAFGSGNFFAQGTDGTPAIRIYFSYVTLATLGYGDYTAATSLGQSLAVAEALLGQLYLVTVVAVLVGRLQRRSLTTEVAESGDSGEDAQSLRP